MNVTWSVQRRNPSRIPHELAWQYALDLMLSYAYTHGIRHLKCESAWQPIAGLIQEPSERGREGGAIPADAVAFLGVDPTWPSGVRTVFVLEEASGRGFRPSPQWTVGQRYSIYTHAAKLYGLVMRLGQWLKRPDIEDWGIFGVRKTFVAQNRRPATYRLAVWVRCEEEHG